MSDITFEQVLRGIQSLPPEALAKLREILNSPSEELQRQEAGRVLARNGGLRDFTADRQWLADHRDEYAGQWVAIKDGQLLSNGSNAKEVHQAANDAGHLDALLVLVESSDAPPFLL
jgi:uncharacterized protein DUF5678